MDNEKLLRLQADIAQKKKELVEGRMDDPQQRTALRELSELVVKRNELTGRNEDIRYLYCDDNECSRFVAGFIGDYSGTKDWNQYKLLVGDIVRLRNDDGTYYDRMVLMNGRGGAMLDQKTLKAREANLIKGFREELLDYATNCAAFTVTLRSCLSDYEHFHAPAMGGMEMK